MVLKLKRKHIFDPDNTINKELFYTICNNIGPKISKESSTLMITSFTQKPKVVSTTAYFALAISEQRKKVLVIDANLRQPSMSDLFGIENSFGLANLLSEVKSSSVIKPVKVTEFLYCLPTGQIPFESSMLFALETNPSLLENWKTQFDIILFHTSNCLHAPDAQIVAKHCDMLVLVVQEGHDKLEKIKTVKKQLERNKHEITGTILIS